LEFFLFPFCFPILAKVKLWIFCLSKFRNFSKPGSAKNGGVYRK
jgi:hypothetical protein